MKNYVIRLLNREIANLSISQERQSPTSGEVVYERRDHPNLDPAPDLDVGRAGAGGSGCRRCGGSRLAGPARLRASRDRDQGAAQAGAQAGEKGQEARRDNQRELTGLD